MNTLTSDFERTVWNGNLNTSYSPEDFVNPGSFESHDKGQRAYVVLNGGFVLGIVFTEYHGYTEQDALDELADSGKIDGLQVTGDEMKDYETGTYEDVGNPHSPDGKGWPNYDGRLITLGNASEYFDLESLDIWVLPSSAFTEDPALMTSDRVMAYLETRRDELDALYRGTETESDEWQGRYRALEDIEDAITLARMSFAR